MKLLMIADVFFPDTVGGAGRVVHHLGQELCRKGHQVHVLTRNTGNRFDSYQKIDDNYFVHRFYVPGNESFNLLVSEIKNSYKASQRFIQESAFDIVCINQTMAAIGPLRHQKLTQLPSIYLYHSPWHQEFLTKRKNQHGDNSWTDKAIAQCLMWNEAQLLRKASKIMLLSKFSLKQVIHFHNINHRKVSIIPGGVDLGKFRLSMDSKESIRNKLSISGKQTVFITVRNLVPRMGIENLIQAFAMSEVLKKKSVLLIGGSGPLEKNLRSMIEDHGLKNTVFLVGRIPDEKLPQFYQGSDYFVLPTVALEGFGLVILEAMACGIPVLGTPVGAIPEILGRFDQKFLFEGTGCKHIKNKLEQVIEFPGRYRYDPAMCQKFVERNYSWKKMADEFEKKALELIK